MPIGHPPRHDLPHLGDRRSSSPHVYPSFPVHPSRRARQVGLIHSGEISVDYTAGHHDGARTLSPATWKIIVSYAAGAGVTAIYAALQRKGIGQPAEKEDFRIVQQEKYGTNKKDPPKDAEAEEA